MSAALLAGAVLAGCGGSAHPASTTHAARPATSTRTTPPGFTTGTGPLPATITQPPATTPTRATTPTAAGSGTAASGSRIPATFTIHAGDRGSPPVVNAPALIPVGLTIVSADGRPHTATIKTNPPHTLTAPPGGRASTLIGGLRDGRYPITLDHRAGALALVIGGQPGP